MLESQIEQPPPPEAARAALDSLCASAPFKTSRQLTAFLRYIVGAVLAGNGETIKAYTIAIDALGRPDNFNPVTDAIVRVEARRLRLALAHYYNGDGAQDPVIIGMLPGSYVPNISWRGADPGATQFGKKRALASKSDAYLACSESVISDGQSTLLRRQLLFARCHRDMAAMWHAIARLQIEIEDSKTVIARSRGLIERSRNGRHIGTA